jgi:septal ring factor EnvC (AmiA/AmiB activator)
MFGLSSCSNKATEDQMKKLRDLDQSRDQLRSDLDHAKGNLSDLQGKIAAQDRDMSDCQQQTAAVREGLTQWPNIWPDSVDWRPAPPPAPPAEKSMKKKHK